METGGWGPNQTPHGEKTDVCCFGLQERLLPDGRVSALLRLTNLSHILAYTGRLSNFPEKWKYYKQEMIRKP